MYDYMAEINLVKKFLKDITFNEEGLILNDHVTYQQTSTKNSIKKECRISNTQGLFPYIIIYEKNLYSESYHVEYNGEETRLVTYCHYNRKFSSYFEVTISLSNFCSIIITNGNNVEIRNNGKNYNISDRRFLLKYFKEEFNEQCNLKEMYITLCKRDAVCLEELEIILEMYPDLIPYCKQLPKNFIEKHRNDSEVRKAGIEV